MAFGHNIFEQTVNITERDTFFSRITANFIYFFFLFLFFLTFLLLLNIHAVNQRVNQSRSLCRLFKLVFSYEALAPIEHLPTALLSDFIHLKNILNLNLKKNLEVAFF